MNEKISKATALIEKDLRLVGAIKTSDLVRTVAGIPTANDYLDKAGVSLPEIMFSHDEIEKCGAAFDRLVSACAAELDRRVPIK